MKDDFLSPCEAIDFHHPPLQDLAAKLGHDKSDVETIRACFLWVRDEIAHSFDTDDEVVTCRASEVLREKTGICYAKSHLLAALLRANHIPAGLGYQRLLLDEQNATYCLHGFNFVFLQASGWLAIDPRGNRADLTTEFDPPRPSLAFSADHPGECTYPQRFASPLPVVVDALTTAGNISRLRKQLPDWDLGSHS